MADFILYLPFNVADAFVVAVVVVGALVNVFVLDVVDLDAVDEADDVWSVDVVLVVNAVDEAAKVSTVWENI